MRVLGIDPGLTRCGLSVIETGKGRTVTALDVDPTTAGEPAVEHRELRLVEPRRAQLPAAAVIPALLLGVALLLFGGTRVANIGKGLGEGIKNFKNALKEEPKADEKKQATFAFDAGYNSGQSLCLILPPAVRP